MELALFQTAAAGRREGEKILVVRNHDDRLRQVLENADQTFEGLGVEAATRLVQQQRLGLHRQDGGQRDEAAFTSREAYA